MHTNLKKNTFSHVTDCDTSPNVPPFKHTAIDKLPQPVTLTLRPSRHFPQEQSISVDFPFSLERSRIQALCCDLSLSLSVPRHPADLLFHFLLLFGRSSHVPRRVSNRGPIDPLFYSPAATAAFPAAIIIFRPDRPIRITPFLSGISLRASTPVGCAETRRHGGKRQAW